jgi:hypothetical protein
MGDYHAIGFCIVLEVAAPTKIKNMFVVAWITFMSNFGI